MAKIISVWGSPGSGKSVFCAALAKYLTQKKEKALIISGDNEVPMLPIWLPDTESPINMSIGNILSSLDINSALIASKVVIMKNYPFIGLLGYAAGDTPLSYPEYSAGKVKQVLTEASGLVDYIIVDCVSPANNLFLPVSIEMADVVVRIFTADPKGIGYFKSHMPILSDARFKSQEHITFAGLARPFHPIDEMTDLVGGFDGFLPYHKEIEKLTVEGNMFSAFGVGSKKYSEALELVYEEVCDE